jgi:hypothetical protein
MASPGLHRRVERECDEIASLATSASNLDSDRLVQALLRVLGLLGELDPLESFLVTQAPRSSGNSQADDAFSYRQGSPIEGPDYGSRLKTAWGLYCDSIERRVATSPAAASHPWERFRIDEALLLVDDGFSFGEAVQIVRSVKRVPRCLAFLDRQTSVIPGSGITSALTSLREEIQLRGLVALTITAALRRVRTLNRLQMVLDIDATANSVGLDGPLPQLSGLLADISGLMLDEIESLAA